MRWRILAMLFLARIGLGFQFQAMASVGDDLAVAYGLDRTEIGFLIGLFMTPGLFLALPAGFSGRHVSDRVLVALGLGALALGGAVSGFATDGCTIGLGRVLAGAGFLFSTLYFTKMTADWFEGREIATAMSILVMSWPFGIAMGQVGHAWLAQVFDWRAPFQAASVYCALAALAVFLLYRPPHELPPVETRTPTRLSGREWRLTVCAGIAWGVFNAGYVVYVTFGPGMLMALGHPVVDAASAISVGSWLMILSGTVCGQLVDRFGGRDVVLAICMAGAVSALIVIGTPAAGLASSLLFGLVGMAPAGVIMALAGQAMRPERRAFGMGIFFTVYYAIMTAAPPIAGAIFDATAQPGAPLAFGMVLFAAVVPTALAYRHFKSAAASGSAVPMPAARKAVNAAKRGVRSALSVGGAGTGDAARSPPTSELSPCPVRIGAAGTAAPTPGTRCARGAASAGGREAVEQGAVRAQAGENAVASP